MSSVKPPPIYAPIADGDTGLLTLPWILFLNSLFTGDTGTTWQPSFTNLTITGTPTITGRYYQIGRSLCYFKVKIVPATDTSSTAGSTYINNFPLTMNGDGACFAISGLLGSSSGACDSASNHVYVPAWAAVIVPLTIVGIVEAS